MGFLRRASRGALGSVGATLALTGLRKGSALVGLVGKTAPEQTVGRLEELGLLEGWSPGARRALTVAAHLGYGAGLGAVFGALRRERGGPADEAAVGSALGVLAWGFGWTALLPLAGVHRPPWKQRTPKVLLPIVDHAFFGAVWGLSNRVLSRKDA